MDTTSVLLMGDLTLGKQLKVARVILNYSQSELAAHASIILRKTHPRFKVRPSEIGAIERGFRLPPWKMAAILEAAGLEVSR